MLHCQSYRDLLPGSVVAAYQKWHACLQPITSRTFVYVLKGQWGKKRNIVLFAGLNECQPAMCSLVTPHPKALMPHQEGLLRQVHHNTKCTKNARAGIAEKRKRRASKEYRQQFQLVFSFFCFFFLSSYEASIPLNTRKKYQLASKRPK